MRQSWWSELGGPSAFSRWTFIYLFPIGMILHLTSGLTALSGVSWITVVAVTAGQTAAAVVGLVVWWGFFGARWREPKPIVAVISFGLIGVVRAVGIDTSLFVLTGQPGYSPVTRAVLGIGLGVISCGLVAVVVGLNRRAHDTVTRLANAEHSIRTLDDDLTQTFQELESDVRRQAQAALHQARLKLAQGATKNDVIALFESLSRDIFRPMAQRLMHHQPYLPSPATAQPGKLGPLTAWRASLGSLVPPDWRLVSILLGSIVLLFYLRSFGFIAGFGLTLVLLAVVVPLVYGLERLLLPHAPLSPRLSLVALLGFAAISVVGIVTVASASGIVTGQSLVSWSALVNIPALAAGISLTQSRLRDLRALEEKLAKTLLEVSSLTQRAQARIDSRKERLVHLLHADIQGSLVAEVLRLRRSGERLGIPIDTLTNVEKLLDNFHSDSVVLPAEDVEVSIRRLIRLWQSATAIRPAIDRQAIDLLNADPERAKAVMDVLSEALTNAIRHGEAGTIEVSVMTTDTTTVRLTVTNPGMLHHAPDASAADVSTGSIGLGRIRTLSTRHTISQAGSRVVLMADFE